MRQGAVLKSLYIGSMKRVLDTLFCVLMAPILAPIMIGIALMISRDGGPVIFKKKRVGKGGRRFTCYKFRTMTENAEDVLEDAPARGPKDQRRVEQIPEALR